MVWYDLQRKLTPPWKPLATSHDQKVLLYLVLCYSVQFLMWRVKRDAHRTSLVIQWLRLYTPNAGGMGLIPDQGTKTPYANSSKKKERERDADKIEDVPDIHGAGKNLWEYCKSLAGYRKDRVDMMTTVMSLKRYFVMRGSHFFKNWRPVPRNMLFTINLLQDYVSHIICKLITKPVSVTVSFLEINHLGKLVTELYFSFKSKG